MRFSSAALAFSLVVVGALSPSSAFVASPAITSSRSSAAVATPATALSMVATNEVVTSEAKPRKTREERLQLASKGLQVHVVGLSIHHCKVEVREKLAIAEAEWNAASNEIIADGVVAEAAVLSTCNRFEVYYSASDPRAAMASVTEYLAQRSGLPVSVLRQNLFMLSGDDAVWHIMRVSGGLDSLIVGEGQILSQVRQCYLHSVEEDGCGGKVLARLLNNALAAGKRVRSETAISKGSVSISSAAVELSEMLSMPDLNLPFSEARLTVVGAGKMTRLLVIHLASRGLEKITIVNRSVGRPQELQEEFPDVDIEIKLMDDLWDVVGRSDIVYTATSSVDYVVDEQKLEENGLASGRPLMLVDISVPRNVNDDCKNIESVTAYSVDDLKAVVAKNTAMRQREMIEAENLLREEADAFIGWRESLSAIPTINQLQERANTFREEELQRCTRKLSNANLNDKELEAVERLSRGIVNKLLHGPMAHLRKTESVEGKQATLKELNAMFRLDEEANGRGRSNRRR
ncbi:Glutamyl-tRNA reductase [Seminavis robusta]|uniref:Glutamyl-tRNA reductase n=1 Tax=Seminavis robusta TaxID=568900 RepID=A0A9N8DZB6_9STRA|nr:Glutamyl-tRNA reductase [Seminavis robusta]|eukprot:Sro361_g126400.1 Glutamyl-tRNA reductase (519) ;mRNA; f:7902-9646